MRQLGIFALLALVLTGCSGETDTPAPRNANLTLMLQLNWKAEPQFGGFYDAKINNSFADRGLEVEIREGGAGAPTIDMLAAGTVPFAVVSGDEIVIARSRGKKIVALFAVYQTHPQGIMARASRGFAEIGDVFKSEGTLGMEQGLGYSEFLKRKFGFERVKIVPTPFGDLSFIRNDENYAMQVFVTSEPLAAKRTGLEVTTFLIADAGYNPYATVLATSEDYLNRNRETVEKMVAAVREGWQRYLDDPSRANETMYRQNPTMDEETFIAAAEAQKPLIETDFTREHGLGAMSRERWKELIDQLVELEIIKTAPKAEECFVEHER